MLNRYCATILLLLPAALFAWDYEDDASASPYGNGLQSGDNGNSGTSSFSSWSVATNGGNIFCLSTTVYGGSGTINTGGRAWGVRARGGTFDSDSPIITRGFSSGLPVGTKISMTLESGNLDFGGSGDYIRAGIDDGGTTGSYLYWSGGANWDINDAGTADTGIPVSTPIRVIWTLQSGSSYDIEVTPLTTGTTYSASRTLDVTSAGVDGVFIRAHADTVASERVIYANSLIIDETGTLPVELDAFMVE